VPQSLIDVVARATERRPEDRYQSASSMARDLIRWQELAEHHASPSTVAKFFDRQGLFEEGEKRVPLRAVLEEDATAVDVELSRRTIDQEEPPNDTLSALIIREDPDPPEPDIGPPAREPTDPDPPSALVDAGRKRDLVVGSLPPASVVPAPVVGPAPEPIIELEHPRARLIGTAISALAFMLSLGFLIFTLTR
jgi:serine/threonine-protein kinase